MKRLSKSGKGKKRSPVVKLTKKAVDEIASTVTHSIVVQTLVRFAGPTPGKMNQTLCEMGISASIPNPSALDITRALVVSAHSIKEQAKVAIAALSEEDRRCVKQWKHYGSTEVG